MVMQWDDCILFSERVTCRLHLTPHWSPVSVFCVQWEDRFYKANRAHTYLGKRVRHQFVVQGRGWHQCTSTVIVHL